jgi:hypothetical protein
MRMEHEAHVRVHFLIVPAPAQHSTRVNIYGFTISISKSAQGTLRYLALRAPSLPFEAMHIISHLQVFRSFSSQQALWRLRF